MRKLPVVALICVSSLLVSCGGTNVSRSVNTGDIEKIKQPSTTAQFLYRLNNIKSVPLYLPETEHTGYLWSDGYSGYIENELQEYWAWRLSSAFKKVCKEDGGKMVRYVLVEGAFTAKEETDDSIKIGDKCEGPNGETIFRVEDIITGKKHWTNVPGSNVFWRKTIIKLWHRDKVIGAKSYSQLIPENPEYKGKKATEVFKLNKAFSLLYKIKGIKTDYSSFIVTNMSIGDGGIVPKYWRMVNKLASFCKTNNGKLYIDGRTLDEFASKLMKENIGPYSFSGKYICKAKNGFTAVARYTENVGDTYYYRVSIKNTSEPVQSQVDNQNNPQVLDDASSVALKTAQTKNIYIKQEGAISYIGYYNGKENGCDLVSVKKKVGNKTEGIMNYKVCNGNVERLPDTVLPSIPKIVRIKARAFAGSCQKYGIMEMNINGYTLKCIPLRDFTKCNVEIRYLKDGRLLDREIINACNLKH